MNSLFYWLDHLVYATPNVEQTIDDLSRMLGVTAAFGGQHPIWGTRNALLALGPKMYLEIMGPDPKLFKPGLKRPFDLDKLYKPRLSTWVSRSEDLIKTVEAGRNVGVDLGEVHLNSILKAFGLELQIAHGKSASLTARIETKQGMVEL